MTHYTLMISHYTLTIFQYTLTIFPYTLTILRYTPLYSDLILSPLLSFFSLSLLLLPIAFSCPA